MSTKYTNNSNSYCTFMDGDVSLYKTTKGEYHCHLCYFIPAKEIKHPTHIMKTLKEVKKHLKEHIKAKHRVPKKVFDRVNKELKNK